MATLEVTLPELERWLLERGQTLDTFSFKRAWPAVSLYLSGQAKQCFAQGRSPDGVPWLPLKRPSKRRGGASAKPLRNTGLLMASHQQGAPGHMETATDTAFTWGSNVSYGIYHQMGTRHVPKREFSGITPQMTDRIALILVDFAAKEMEK